MPSRYHVRQPRFACPCAAPAYRYDGGLHGLGRFFTCDVCGTTKGEANHWWMLSHADCACDEDDQVPQRFSVMPWSASQSRNPEMRHLCGKGCAMQALERFMTQRPVISSLETEDDAIAQRF